MSPFLFTLKNLMRLPATELGGQHAGLVVFHMTEKSMPETDLGEKLKQVQKFGGKGSEIPGKHRKQRAHDECLLSVLMSITLWSQNPLAGSKERQKESLQHEALKSTIA